MGVRSGPYQGDTRFHVFSFFFIFSMFFSFKCISLLASVSETKMDVSSVGGAPWRCGVLTTLGGIAGIGLGHQHGREHESTPSEWSGGSSPVKTENNNDKPKKSSRILRVKQKLVEIVDIFVQHFNNNNDTPWKSSRILRARPKPLDIFLEFEFCMLSFFSCFPFFLLLFSLFLLCFSFFFLFFLPFFPSSFFSVVRADAKTGKKTVEQFL